MEEIRSRPASTWTACNEIEEVTQHDVIAFVSCVAENMGDASKYIHYGLTSSDVLDTGLALQLQAAGGLLEEETERAGPHPAAAGAGAPRHRHDRPHTRGARRAPHFRHGAGAVGVRDAAGSGAAASEPPSRSRWARSRARWAPTPTSTPRWNRSPWTSWIWKLRPSRRR